MVFKVVAGVEADISLLWSSTDTLNENKTELLNTTSTPKENYKNRLVREWQTLGLKEVRKLQTTFIDHHMIMMIIIPIIITVLVVIMSIISFITVVLIINSNIIIVFFISNIISVIFIILLRVIELVIVVVTVIAIDVVIIVRIMLSSFCRCEKENFS